MKKILVICACLFLLACEKQPAEYSLAHMEMHGISWEDITLKQVKKRIKQGDDVNAIEPTEYGWSILGRASSYPNNIDIVKFLLDSGANVNLKDATGATALMKAGLSGDIEIIKLLLEAGADVNARSYDGESALLYAIRPKNAKAEIIKLLIESGAEVNVIGEYGTALESLCSIKDPNVNNEEMLKLFLSKGADINIRNKILGGTPLHASVYSERVDVVEFLLNNGADINAKNKLGQTVLHKAVWEKNATQIINFLATAKKVSLETLDVYGRSPVVAAISSENAKNLEVLITNGARIDKTYKGLTMLDFAVSENKGQDIIKILLKYGAKPSHKTLTIANETIKKSDVYWEMHDIVFMNN